MKFTRLFAANIFRYLGFIWHSSPKWSIDSILLVVLQGFCPLDQVGGGFGGSWLRHAPRLQLGDCFHSLLGAATLLEAWSFLDRREQ
jgi:hypothetical protein